MSEAAKDYDGVNNTEVLSSIWGGDSEAAGYCKNFIFPNGNHGYLGSAGEWKILWNYKEDINKSLWRFNELYEIGDGYWTSTKHTEGEGLEDMDGNIISSEHYFYAISFGELESLRAYGDILVRPFTTL